MTGAHTDPIFKNLCILPLNDMYHVEIGKIIFQFETGVLPDILNNHSKVCWPYRGVVLCDPCKCQFFPCS